MESFIENLKKHQLMVAIRTKTPEDAYNADSLCRRRDQVYRDNLLCA
jgi:hypothetical protein